MTELDHTRASRKPDSPPTLNLTAIVVTYNHERTILACLNALAMEVDDIIVVDNKSSDRTVGLVMAMAGPRIRLLPQDGNLGFAKAVNLGMSMAKAGAIAVVNPDVEVCRGALRHLAALVMADKSVGIAAPRLVYPDGRPQASARRFPNVAAMAARRIGLALPSRRSVHDKEPLDPVCVDWVIGAVMVIRSDIIDHVGALDEWFFLYAEDVDWCTRMWRAGFSVVLDPRVSCVHEYGRASGRTLDLRNRATRLHWVSLLKLLRRYPGLVLGLSRMPTHGQEPKS